MHWKMDEANATRNGLLDLGNGLFENNYVELDHKQYGEGGRDMCYMCRAEKTGKVTAKFTGGENGHIERDIAITIVRKEHETDLDMWLQ